MTDIAPEIPEEIIEIQEAPPVKRTLGKVIGSYQTRIVIREEIAGTKPPELDVLNEAIHRSIENLSFATGESAFTATVESERLDR